MRITLTRDFRKITTSYGLFQNLSPDANVELTESVQSEGIVLRPYQIVTVNRTVWARKLSGAGTGVLAVLPFADSDETSDDETSDDGETSGETVAPQPTPHRPPAPPHHNPPPKPVFVDPCVCEPFPKPPHCPPPPHHHPHDDADSYVIKIPRALIDSGQSKFVVDFSR